ncbi:MAG: LysE family transporter [Bacteroidia bacterium]|nr:LysE family transporter [Bacteroidia bacterium]
MDIILNGVVSGVVLAFLIGPVFFTLIQTSIERGFWSGFFVAIGVSLSDAFYIALAYLGLSQALDSQRSQVYLAYGGGAILLGFGVYYLFVKSRKLTIYDPEKIHTRSPLRLIVKGFVINGISPMVLFFWIASSAWLLRSWGIHILPQHHCISAPS